MSMVSPHGAHVATPYRNTPPPPTTAQVQARRNALWLRAVDYGLYDPVLDRKRVHSPAELALLWGVTLRTVQLGIASARKLREALACR